jgi:hypothetical protein
MFIGRKPYLKKVISFNGLKTVCVWRDLSELLTFLTVLILGAVCHFLKLSRLRESKVIWVQLLMVARELLDDVDKWLEAGFRQYGGRA